MNEASDVQWQEWDASAAGASEVTSAGTRRLLLAGASGLVLAASGLFLPDWLEEAEARKGALGGARGGRRGQNRRGRHGHKKRTHGNRKKKQRARDKKVQDIPLPFRQVALTVYAELAEPLPCTFFYARKKPGDNFEPFNSNGNQTIPEDGSYRYDPEELRVGVLIRQIVWSGGEQMDMFCDVRNVTYWYPRGGVTAGFNLDPTTGNVGSAYIPEVNFAENEEKYNQRAVLRRLKDDSNGARRIEWKLTVR